MKLRAFISLFLLAALSFSFAEAKRPLVAHDYFALKDVSSPQISPDGKWVAYVVSNPDETKDESLSNIWMAPVSGGDPIQVTFSGSDDNPQWSPDNKYLAFVSERGKKSQIYLLNRTGGEASALTDVEQDIEGYEWSPDGKKMLIVLKDADPDAKGDDKAAPPYVITRTYFKFDGIGYLKELYKHIYVFDLGTRALKQITSGPYDDVDPIQADYSSAPHWSSDGKQIVFVSNRSENWESNTNSDVFVVSSEGGEPKKLTTNEGPDEMANWSPDGKSIVYVTSLEPNYLWFDQLKIAVIPAAGGKPQMLTGSIDRNTWDPRYSPDGSKIYFFLEDAGTQRVVSIPATGGEITEASSEKIVYAFDVARDGTLAVQAARADLPGDIFAVAGGKTVQLSRVNEQALKSIELAAAERIRFNSKDGTSIEGFVLKPPGFKAGKKYPAVVWMHGGPNEQETGEFYFRTQFLAAQGYVVLLISYRGSTGYGKAFQQSIYKDWGNKEIDDVLAGLDFAIGQGYVDADHVGMGGHSYGAILTDYMITKTDRFKAAITDAGESNFLMNYGVDQYLLDWEAEVGKPWENPQRFIEMSPYFKLKNAKTPTLIVCGQEDWNVPLINSEQLYQSLHRMGVDTMLLVYPEQPHEFWRPSYIEDRFERYAAWYAHFLKGAPGKTPPKKEKTKDQ